MVRQTPPKEDWKEKLARQVRERLPREDRARALEILNRLEPDEGLKRLAPDYILQVLLDCACIPSATIPESPTFWHDVEEVKRQAKAARSLYQRMRNLVVNVSDDPNASAMLHSATWPKGEPPPRPYMTDAEILWALETVVDYLKLPIAFRRTRLGDWRKFSLLMNLEDQIRKANLKGARLDAAIAKLMTATYGTPYKSASIKPLRARARSFLRKR